MADDDASATTKPNEIPIHSEQDYVTQDHLTLNTILNRFIATVFFPDPNYPAPLLHRIKSSLSDNGPLLRDASRNTAHHVLLWTRRGSPLRALLVVSAGTTALLTLTGLLVFMLFFAAATVNAVVISLLMSLAAAGGFLALFFTSVAAIYVAALLVAVFVISTATISAVMAILIATGWIGFFWTLYLAARKSVAMAKYSVSITGSALSAYSTSRYAQNNHVSKKSD